jgi:O-antigen ligase
LTKRAIDEHSTSESGAGTGVVDKARDETLSQAPDFSGTAIFAAFAAVALPTALLNNVLFPTFTPKFLVLLVVGAGGVVPLFRLAQSGRASLAAKGAIAFLVIALVSVFLSPAWNLGFFGLYTWGTGWFLWLGCAGAFALGARLRRGDLDLVLGGIVLGALVNAGVAIYQMVKNPSGALALYDGNKSSGLLGNPIHLEGLLLGAIALLLGKSLLPAKGWRPAVVAWWAIVAVLTVGLQFTLERLALPILAVILVAALVVHRLRALPFAGVVLAAFGGAYLWKGAGLAQQVTAGTSDTTYRTRVRIWVLALKSLVHHPLVGIGPGQLISAVAPKVSEAFQIQLKPGLLPSDSHDFIIEVLATTGVLGFACFAVWMLSAFSKARGPFLACALAMLAVELVEPLNIGVTPVAFLAFGAATVLGDGPGGFAGLAYWWRHLRDPRPAVGPPPGLVADSEVAPGSEGALASGDAPGSEASLASGGAAKPGTARPLAADELPRGRVQPGAAIITAALVVAALFLGGTMVVGDQDMLKSQNTVTPSVKLADALDANRLLPYWPQSASSVASAYDWAFTIEHTPVLKALPWAFKAARRDPADPLLRADIGAVYETLQEYPQAIAEYQDALKLDPWTLRAFVGLGTVEADEGHWTEALHWLLLGKAVSVPPSSELLTQIHQDESHIHP